MAGCSAARAAQAFGFGRGENSRGWTRSGPAPSRPCAGRAAWTRAEALWCARAPGEASALGSRHGCLSHDIEQPVADMAFESSRYLADPRAGGRVRSGRAGALGRQCTLGKVSALSRLKNHNPLLPSYRLAPHRDTTHLGREIHSAAISPPSHPLPSSSSLSLSPPSSPFSRDDGQGRVVLSRSTESFAALFVSITVTVTSLLKGSGSDRIPSTAADAALPTAQSVRAPCQARNERRRTRRRRRASARGARHRYGNADGDRSPPGR